VRCQKHDLARNFFALEKGLSHEVGKIADRKIDIGFLEIFGGLGGAALRADEQRIVERLSHLAQRHADGRLAHVERPSGMALDSS